MKKIVGKVVEIFIPKQYKNGCLLDIMECSNIGFKIETENGLEEIVLEQEEGNASIMREDIVIVREQILSGKKFIDIEKYVGEEYE